MANNKAFKVKNGLELGAISDTIDDTAVDVFVYDTTKDSDGGAWRHRTQNTSWYNETLNTATRGSRKEFPAVAVIVAEDGTLTIYDGDDPDLPMWMVFNGTSDSSTPMLRIGMSSVAMLNGQMAIGHNGSSNNNRLGRINFITEAARVYYGASVQDWVYDIKARNRSGENGYRSVVGYDDIVNRYVNDVTMTVMPNAPIDDATGLPVPMLAIATNGGVSVFKENGEIVSSTHSYGSSTRLSVTPEGLLYATHNGPTSGQALEVIDLETLKPLNTLTGNNAPFHGTNTVGGQHRYYGFGANLTTASHVMPYLLPRWGADAYHSAAKDYFAFGGDGDGFGASNSGEHRSLFRLVEYVPNPAYGLLNLTSSSYNTGWLAGDARLATLSDTDATNITGSELLNPSEWSLPTGFSYSSPNLSYDGSGSQYSKATERLSGLTVGQTYTVSFNVTAISGSSVWFVAHDQGAVTGHHGGVNFTSTGQKTFTFKAETAQDYIVVQNNSALQTFTIADISVRISEPDHTVYGNGLQVFGTVTKSAAATGTDLVAYSGFSASNYLQQPYTDKLNFGSGDFAFICWFNIDDPSDFCSLFDNGYGDPDYVNAGILTDGTWNFRTRENGVSVNLTSNRGTLDDGAWHCIVAARRDGVKELWFDGVLDNTQDDTSDINAGDELPLRVGLRADGLREWQGSIALFRASKTVPSPEQIKRMYEDEKFLFRDGAQATLYGTSDPVTAVAYDDSTDLLHVGTSAGRSVFQGLRRVDNTATAVSAAVSASNGLVADE